MRSSRNKPIVLRASPPLAGRPLGRLRRSVAGKAIGATWRRRGQPTVAVRCALARRRERHADPPPRGSSATLFIVPAGPNDALALVDTLASIRHYEQEANVVVLADGAFDLDRAAVERSFPGAHLWRPPRLSGGPPRLSPPLLWAYQRALAEFPFDVLCKLDSDALLTGTGLGSRAADHFCRHPTVGLLGSTMVRADGARADLRHSASVLAHERRWSPSVREAVEAAERRGWSGNEAHGGVYLLSRRAVEALEVTHFLEAAPPWWSLVGEDLWLALGVAGAGYGIASFGAPGEPLASGQGFLPLPKEVVLERELLAVHSVRRGLQGENEATLRAFFRAARGQAEADAPGRTVQEPASNGFERTPSELRALEALIRPSVR
jgi:hypothetical protein